jgi:hypothetical protein
MHSRIQCIRIGDEVARMLVTPSLFSIARKRGINANIGAGATAIDIHDIFIRIMYCAYLNYAEVERMDNPDYPEPNLKLMDFVVWAADNQREASEMVEVIFELVTGKSLKKEEEGTEKKKKTKNRRT